MATKKVVRKGVVYNIYEITQTRTRRIYRLEEARKHKTRTHRATWGRVGFLPVEQHYLSEISRDGSKAPYIQAMIKRRRGMLNEAIRDRQSLYEYQRRVLGEYESVGIRAKGRWETYAQYFDRTFYDYLIIYQERYYDPEWISPKKKRRLQTKGKKAKEENVRLKQLRQEKEAWNDKINKAIQRQDIPELRRLEVQRNKVQNKIDRIES